MSARLLNPSRAELKAMDAENRRFPVGRLVEIPREDWPSKVPPKLVRALRCREFLVQVYAEDSGVTRLSIQRCAFDRKTGRWVDGITWDDLQRLKGLAGYGDAVAVELYPPDHHVVNVANLRHLWVLDGAEPPFMWRNAGEVGK